MGLLITALDKAASACPVCFGQADGTSGLFRGFAWGFVILLGFTFSIIGALVAAVVNIERRREAADRAAEAR